MPFGSRAGDAGGRNRRVDFGPPPPPPPLTVASGSNGNKSDGSRTVKKLGAVAKAVAATVVAERQVVARTSLMDVKSGKDVYLGHVTHRRYMFSGTLGARTKCFLPNLLR